MSQRPAPALYRYQVSAVSTDGEESPVSTSVSAIPAGMAPSDDTGAFAYLWFNNSRHEPAADWCWDDQDVPTFCGSSKTADGLRQLGARPKPRTPSHACL
jgi:hypothetical protein